MKILELTRYFVDRYKLPKKFGYEDGDMDENEEIATYRTAISRILKSKKIHGNELWNIIKPEKGDRNISVDDFIKFCFPEWKKYLLNNYKEDLEKNDTLKYLEEDEEEYLKSNEWYLKAQERIQRHNKAIEEYDFEEIDNELRYGITTYYEGSKEVLEKALQFQIQALFELYFEELDLKEIAKDMTLIGNCDTSYNPTITEEEEKAFNRIASYKNYTKRK